MKPELDGRGGGYGKFSGMTLGEIQEIYARCETDPSMRSVSVVLRVAREQLEARGGLGHYPVYVAIAATALVGTIIAKPFLPAAMQESLPKTQIGLAVITAALTLGVILTSRDRKAGLAQERAICDATIETLEKIISLPGFKAKPLDFTQDLTVKELIKKGTPSKSKEAVQTNLVGT